VNPFSSRKPENDATAVGVEPLRLHFTRFGVQPLLDRLQQANDQALLDLLATWKGPTL
jgi:hypothetical protein